MDPIIVLRYLDLLRVPLLVTLVLLLLPYVALFTSARSLLAGLFDLTPRGTYFASLAAVAVSWAVLFCSRLILSASRDRFLDVAAVPVPLGPLTPWAVAFGLLAVPMIAAALWVAPRQGFVLRCLAALLAVATMAVLFALGWKLFDVSVPEIAGLARQILDPLARRAPAVFRGYVGEDLQFHLAAAAGFAVALALYAALGILSWRRFGGRTVPALTSVLQLLVLVCWGLSGLSFFFDAYRVPVLLVLGLWFAVVAQSQASDHYYHLHPRAAGGPGPPTPAEALAAKKRDRVIVVAANGGGIQAAAWTARVLTGLRKDLGADFSQSIGCISAVSGGSVGAMHFVNAYDRGEGFEGFDGINRVVGCAEQSSLDEVAWGLVYPDLWRLVFPPLVKALVGATGRGQALEEAWKRRDAGLEKDLSAWQAGVRRGDLPAVIFNATLAERGFRFLFSTAPLAPGQGVKGSHAARLNFEQLYPGSDLAIATAVRLSATFPYVSPAARADLAGPQPHVVDGGYFDNFGMSTLVEWLDAALEGGCAPVQHVLVLQIRGAKVPPADAAQAKEVSSRGWFYQAFAPIATMLKVRDAGQVSHNETEYGLLHRAWEGKIDLQSKVFEFPGENPPNSWHLTKEQKQAIEDAWDSEPIRGCRELVREFMEGAREPLSGPRSLD